MSEAVHEDSAPSEVRPTCQHRWPRVPVVAAWGASEPHRYTFWDYQAGRWQKDEGLRIDHLLLSPQAADLLSASGIDRKPRNNEKPSDHTPVWCELEM